MPTDRSWRISESKHEHQGYRICKCFSQVVTRHLYLIYLVIATYWSNIQQRAVEVTYISLPWQTPKSRLHRIVSKRVPLSLQFHLLTGANTNKGDIQLRSSVAIPFTTYLHRLTRTHTQDAVITCVASSAVQSRAGWACVTSSSRWRGWRWSSRSSRRRSGWRRSAPTLISWSVGIVLVGRGSTSNIHPSHGPIIFVA